ncbi:MAG: hypothetical protein CML29_03445 [Rhizobiales bacterium]|nr:hypothetical protein [Hyphomicrobiales bacterium]MBA67854.1 hypothetical protein [Hyphomicrobiales bacterium]
MTHLKTRAALALLTAAFAIGCAGMAAAGDRKTDRRFVGTWDGFTGVPIYTKLVFDDAGRKLTYCNVQSCRNVNCFDMAYTGSLQSKFAYKDELRSWKFEWIDENRLLGEFTNNEGETAFAWYAPEDTPLESLTK